ncbi:MAG: hypothetical protein AAGL24_16615 [Pseudomonadota bacterium]
MKSRFPRSLLFFAATAAVFVLQLLPLTGVFLMFMLAAYWSVLLINAGMIGVAVEAAIGRVSRWWLVLPLLFYGGYWAAVTMDHIALRSVASEYQAANARVTIPFDPDNHSLVFDDHDDTEWLIRNYDLPVAYNFNRNFPEEHRSHRLVDTSTCNKIRGIRGAYAARVRASVFYEGEDSLGRKPEERFCILSMPERPNHPVLRVSEHEEKEYKNRLPINRLTTSITMPDGQHFELSGGFAAPLSWFPRPVMGCGLNSAAAKWECAAQFWRKGFTPIIEGDTRFRRDAALLAHALGLNSISLADRDGADQNLVLARAAAITDTTLARQLADIDAILADRPDDVVDWDVDVVVRRPETLTPRAHAIVAGLERAAANTEEDGRQVRRGGKILARLVASLRDEEFLEFGSRILAVYGEADREHWLWDVRVLMPRLGDLGMEALPVLVDGRALDRSSSRPAIEGICRVGVPGRAMAGPVLLDIWTKSRDSADLRKRTWLYVTMRRLGMSPPPLLEDERNQFDRLQDKWGDVSPQSQSSVCAFRSDLRAQRNRKSK